MKPLTDLKEGQSAYILDLRNDHLCIEFFEKGCFPGDKIYVIENSPFKKFVTFRSGRYFFRLYRKRAMAVITGITDNQFCLN